MHHAASTHGASVMMNGGSESGRRAARAKAFRTGCRLLASRCLLSPLPSTNQTARCVNAPSAAIVGQGRRPKLARRARPDKRQTVGVPGRHAGAAATAPSCLRADASRGSGLVANAMPRPAHGGASLWPQRKHGAEWGARGARGVVRAGLRANRRTRTRTPPHAFPRLPRLCFLHAHGRLCPCSQHRGPQYKASPPSSSTTF